MNKFLKHLYVDSDNSDNVRYGQAFCNFFNITDAELFYADEEKAMEIICEKYIVLDPEKFWTEKEFK